MNGYKLLDEGFINEYGFEYELNKTYYLTGELRWNYNGFHFCTNIEDTLRYRDKNKDTFVIVEVVADGEIVDGHSFENDYYGYETGYASSVMTILREIKRDEMINMVINSNNVSRVTRLILSIPLSDEEIKMITDRYPQNIVQQYIEYYQYDKKDSFYKKIW